MSPLPSSYRQKSHKVELDSETKWASCSLTLAPLSILHTPELPDWISLYPGEHSCRRGNSSQQVLTEMWLEKGNNISKPHEFLGPDLSCKHPHPCCFFSLLPPPRALGFLFGKQGFVESHCPPREGSSHSSPGPVTSQRPDSRPLDSPLALSVRCRMGFCDWCPAFLALSPAD